MVCFLPGYLTKFGRERLAAYDAEKARLQILFPDDTEKFESAMAEWRRVQPRVREAALSDVADHIDHIRMVAGIGHIGIGSDFDGFFGPPEGLEDVSKYPALLAELLRRGYSKDDVRKVAGQNVLRVMRAVERAAKSR
jgi:membrane dipeptidase